MATKRPSRTRAPRPWRWTRAHLARLPNDGHRYEVLDGALLVTPQARLAHQEVVARLIEVLRPYCRTHELGVAVGPGAVVWSDNELQPDVQVIPLPAARVMHEEWETVPPPLLVIEVLSQGSERHDRGKKRAAYLMLGIPEYWIVDIDARSVTVHMPGAAAPMVVTGALPWTPRADVPALEIDLVRLLGGP
ncbi:MAG: Uma2 family endonuclease [Gemmatimonadota bacterium]|nr:Uma2 family endonuclease [Gemmatimonadota bacterium]